jgi:hypothetical protein
MGGQYVIAAVNIEDSAKLGLKFEKEFSSPDSFWDLYLYSVGSSDPNHAPVVSGNAVAERRMPGNLATR